MKFYYFFILLVFLASGIKAQELFVFSEPASNMPAKAIGVRLSNQGRFAPEFQSRTTPELMIGFNKKLMAHVQGFFSDADGSYRFEGASLYAKYRFLSVDGPRKHSRLAAFLRVSDSKRKVTSEDINLEGDNSGVEGGLVFTQLLHKLALSGTLGYIKGFNAADHQLVLGSPASQQQIAYTLSSGYLLLPVKYKNYNQPNVNAYFEVLGRTNPSNGHSYLDFAPALQLIINSVTRIDLGYRFQLSGNMENRYNKNMYMAKLEFNLFNVLP
jgi:hypothetical protein